MSEYEAGCSTGYPPEVMDYQHVDAVKNFARKNYNVGGWDYVIETMDDKEIAEEIQGAKDACDAIMMMAKLVNALDEQRREVRAEIF